MNVARSSAVVAILSLLAMVIMAHQAQAGAISAAQVNWFGRLVEEPIYFRLRDDTLVNPGSRLLSFPELQNRAFADVNVAIISQPFNLVTKLRPTLETESGDTVATLPVDDLYLDANLLQRAFLTLGVKNYREGVGLSFNPTDFLAENKEQDFSKREEERRADREGNLVTALDLFFQNLTLSAIVAPRFLGLQDEDTRAVFKVSRLFEDAKLDAAVGYFVADRPGVGLNLSETIGDQLEVHSEIAGRWGSDRKLVRKMQEPVGTVQPALFEIRDPSDEDEVFVELVVGSSYTFSDGTNLISEYYFVQDGYSDSEWDEVLDFIEASRSQFLGGTFQDLGRGNLLRANELLTFRTLRRHYLFFRLHHTNLLEKFDASISLLLNAEDRSFAVAPVIDFIGLNNLSLGINGTILEGPEDSEFGLSPFGARVSFLLRYFF